MAVDTNDALPRARRAHKGSGVDSADPRPHLCVTVSEKNGEDASMSIDYRDVPAAPTSPRAAASPSPVFPLPSPPRPNGVGGPMVRFMPEGFTAIGPVYGERKAREWSLVLQSIEIWHVVHHTQSGWVLLVRDQDYERARTSIDKYEVENRDWPPKRARERPRHPESRVPLAMFVALTLFFLITGPVAGGSGWFQRGTAVTDLVLSSAPWRAVTALTLHADTAHVLGNAVSGTIFVSAVSRRLGPGGGALAVLASGVLGNVMNAVYQRGIGNGSHASIGASTAIFGAIGLLAATQIALDHNDHREAQRGLLERAAPFVGGLALLGALGASPSSDLGAHLFGLVAGLVIGLVVGFPLRWRKSNAGPLWLQASLGAVAAVVILGSWQLAIHVR